MTDFPKTIILPDEASAKRHELRTIVQKVQTAFLALRDDPDFVMPEWGQLTPQYSRNYYRPFLSSIDRDLTIDEVQRKRLRNKWERIQAQTTTRINHVLNGIEATPQLKWQWDDNVKLPVPTASIDTVADQMTTHNVPSRAAYHWALLQKVVEAYKEMRYFEEKNHIGKKHLQWLFRHTPTTFAEQWASGFFEQAEAPDQATADRWRIMNQTIF